MTKRRSIILFFTILLGCGLAIWLYTKPQSAENNRRMGKRNGTMAVRIVPVAVQNMPVILEAQGTTEAEQSVAVRPQVGGILQQVLFKEGDTVKAGQVLFQIDASTFRASQEHALAALARDQAQAEEATARQKRLESLVQKEYVTRQEYEQAVAEAKAARATVDANRAQLKEAQLQYERARVRAPISGRTGSLNVKTGDLVSANPQDPLVVINSIHPALISFRIPQQQLNAVRQHSQSNTPLRVEIRREKEQPAIAVGELIFIDNTVDTSSGTIKLKARVDNRDEAIWPGEFVTVRLILSTEPNAIVVPEAAVQLGQKGPFVYIAEEGHARMQTIQIDRQLGSQVVIKSGLKGHEQVIVSPPQQLKAGSEVRALEQAELRAKNPDEKPKGKRGHKDKQP